MTKADKFKQHCDTIVVRPSDINQNTVDLIAIIKHQIVQLCKIHYDLITDLSISEANYFFDYIGNSFFIKEVESNEEKDSGVDIVMVCRLYQNVYYDPNTETLEAFINYSNDSYDEMFLYSYLYKNIANKFAKNIGNLPSIIDKVYDRIKNTEERERIVNGDPVEVSEGSQEDQENLNPF